jgi:hypothetical protein
MDFELSFMQLLATDGKAVEGAMSRYAKNGKLKDGYWSVSMASGEDKIMHESEMPEHWIGQLREGHGFFEWYLKARKEQS